MVCMVIAGPEAIAAVTDTAADPADIAAAVGVVTTVDRIARTGMARVGLVRIGAARRIIIIADALGVDA